MAESKPHHDVVPRERPERQDNEYLRTGFFERLAHELRGPAGVIHGSLQELESALGSRAEEHELFLAMAKRGLKRILRTADRLQHTGQLERSPPELTLTETDLGALTTHSVEDAKALESRKKIQVEIEVPQTPSSYPTDSRWLGTALFELASNAIRHASELVRVKVVRTDVGGYEISFTDDGRAAVEFGPSRFQPLRDGRGLGLGLAIASDVVAAHGGVLRIECGMPTQQGFGARVVVALPPH
jgi:signal transduction histidine kinase